MQQAKFLLHYVDDEVKTVKGEPHEKLRPANLLHPILQFTIETSNTSRNWQFWTYKIVLTKTEKLTVDGVRNKQIQVPD